MSDNKQTKTTMPATFDEAMLEFQKLKVQAVEDSTNPHFKSSYASLESVMRACDEGNQFGLVYSQPLDIIEVGGIVFQIVSTRVTHVPSGETRSSACPIRMKDPDNPQQMGSGISYAKRYALQAFYGLCSDDDANIATDNVTKILKDAVETVDVTSLEQCQKFRDEHGIKWDQFRSEFQKLKDGGKIPSQDMKSVVSKLALIKAKLGEVTDVQS